MRYQGPIYRPPSEADSLLVQATVGCPHNKCTFCMVYKKGPAYRVRPVSEIKEDLDQAAREFGAGIKSLFLPAGNSMAMPTGELAEVCSYATGLFPDMERITVYSSMPSISAHGPGGLDKLRAAGLKRLHVGLESGHGPTLKMVKKGCTPQEQVRAGEMALKAGLELNLYVVLGLAGPGDSLEHARATAHVLNQITAHGPVSVRLRTLVPKINTLLLHQIKKGRFCLCTPHEVLREARELISRLNGPAGLFSDHYTNYVDLRGVLPADRDQLIRGIDQALDLPRSAFRQDFVGTQ